MPSMFDSTRNLREFPELKKVVLAAFPGYRKPKCYAGAFSPMPINSYWDGGSRDEFAIVELATMRRHPLPTTSHPFFDVARHGLANQSDGVVSSDHVGNVTLNVLPSGFALVEAGVFCGKPATAKVYLNPADITPALPAVVRS